MPSLTHCPNPDTLRRLMAGQLSRHVMEQLADHFETCEFCGEMLTTLPDKDAMVQLLRTLSGNDRDVEPPAWLTPLMDQIKTPNAFTTAATFHSVQAALHSDDGNFRGTNDGLPIVESGKKNCQVDWLGDYRILRVLGRGGMGTVFEAEDLKLRRKVALKVLHPKTLTCEGARELFLSEARALAAVQNDHVVPIYQVGEVERRPYLVMPVLAGESLAARLERVGALPIPEVCRIGGEIAAGLAAIHAKGLIHRDLKPANIWLEADTQRVKVLDLGLALYPQSTGQGLAGTPAYMSPEQAEGRELDGRSDLFSLGSVLYECATGRRPYYRSTVADTIRAIRNESPVSPARVNPAIPDSLSKVIEQLQRKLPSERPVSALTVRSLLVSESPLHPVSTTANTHRRPWRLFAGAAVVLLALASLVWRSFVPGSSAGVSDQGSVSSRATAQGAEADIGSRVPTGSPKITAFDITHFARVEDGSQVENRGVFGQTTWSARQKDLVTLAVKLDQPAYVYLLAFRPDGVLELCYPEQEHVAPPLSTEASYPSDASSRTKAYGLSESAGLWIFAAMASPTPLPAFDEWKKSHPLPTLQKIDGMPGIVLVDDGQEIKHFSAADPGRGTRGKGEELPGQQSLSGIVDALQQSLSFGSVWSIGIVAEPIP